MTREKLKKIQWRPCKEEFKLSKFKNAVGKCNHRWDSDPFSNRINSVDKDQKSSHN
jgi:hypothetical protein